MKESEFREIKARHDRLNSTGAYDDPRLEDLDVQIMCEDDTPALLAEVARLNGWVL